MKNLQWSVLAVVLALGCGDNYPGPAQVSVGSGGSTGTAMDAAATVPDTGGSNQPALDAGTDVSISIVSGDPEHCGPSNMNCTREGMVTACLNNTCTQFACITGYRAIGNSLANGCEMIPVPDSGTSDLLSTADDANVLASDTSVPSVVLDGSPPSLDVSAIDMFVTDALVVPADMAIDVPLSNPDSITLPSTDSGLACAPEGQVDPDLDSSYCFDAVKGDGRVTCVNHTWQCVYSPPVNPRSCVGFRPNEYDMSSWCRVNADCPYGVFVCNGQTALWECVPIFGPDILPTCFAPDAGTDSLVIISHVDAGIDTGIDMQPKIDSSTAPDALLVTDLPPDVSFIDTGTTDAGPMPVVGCTVVEGNPSMVTVTFSGYTDRSLNAAVFDYLATASGKKQYCVVGDFNGWSGRLNCQAWVADPKTLVFPNIPVRTPQANSRINLTLDLGNNTEQWVDDTRVIVQPSSRCANLPGLNIVVN